MSRTSMQGPGSQNNPDGLSGDLASRLRGADSRIGKLERGAPLSAAGIHVSPEGMTIDSELHITGDTVIDGTLSLPAGIIDNDALTSPQTQKSNFGNSSAFAIPGLPSAVLASFTVTVPAGYTKASYIAEGASGVNNITGSSNYSYLRVFASGPSGYLTWGSRQNVQIDPGATRTASALLVRAVTVPLVGGDVLTFWCEVYADNAMGASGANFASAAALVTFTR